MGFRFAPARTAYTLIEVLAVVVLLALVATLIAPSVIRRASADPIAAAAESLREAEALQRHRAIGSGVCLVLLSHGLAVRGEGAHSGQHTLVDLPSSLSLRWLDHAGNAAANLPIDSEGRSDDVVLVIDDGHRDERYEVFGLTGEWCQRALSGMAIR